MSEKIEEYSDALARVEELQRELSSRREEAIPPEVRQALQELEDEYMPIIQAAQEQLERIKDEIVSEVLKTGKSIKGSRHMAVWNEGKITWDGTKLAGFSIAHPEILEACNTGNPTVSFKRVL